MAERETTPAPTAVAADSSPMTPAAKRVRTTSPSKVAVSDEPRQGEVSTEAPAALQQPEQADNHAPLVAEQSHGPSGHEEVEAEDEVEADDDFDRDSVFGSDKSDTTSITSSVYQGYVENGRRYQTVREGEYWGPSDAKQFESLEAAHIVYRILDSNEKNPLFRSPIPGTAQNILDVGTGSGIWALEVADQYKSAFVQGVDLSPPPEIWVAPNCKFEVDDVLKPWMFRENGRFDLIHMRDLFGSFADEQWRLVYKQAYNNLAPGGWIEQVEAGIGFYSDDGTLKPDWHLAKWEDHFTRLCATAGKPINTVDTFKARIKAGGFTNIHEKLYKVPLGDWAKNPVLKEAGGFFKAQVLAGMEGYAMFLLTKFGEPTPWTPDEVQVYLAKIRNEINTPGLHAYCYKRRVWAQKPYNQPKAH